MFRKPSETRAAIAVSLLAGTILASHPAFAQAENSGSKLPATEVPQQPTSAASDAAVATGAGVEEIIVTAQKREQNLQNVPISITALTGAALTANRIVDVRDLSAIAPNLTVREASGGSNQANYSMRGIVTGGSAAGTDKGVSLYIDGVYIQNVLGSVFQLADIERIEVLRGPQGTLFGRNATAGAISVTTRNPTGDFGIRQELTYGNYDQLRSKTRVDLPKFGPVSISATYVHSERRGDTRNLGAGTVWHYGPATNGVVGDKKSPKYLGNENIEAFAAAVKLDLVDKLDLIYKFDYTENHYSPDAEGTAGIYPPAAGPLAGGLIAAELAFQPDQAVLTQVSSHRPKAVNNAFTVNSYTRSMGHSLTTRYTFNDQVSVKDIIAVRSSVLRNFFQLDGLGGLINVIPQVGPVGAPYIFLANAGENNERQFSNEIQFNVDTDPLTVTAGYIHFHDHQVQGGFPGSPNVIQFRTVPNFVIPSSPTIRNRVTVDSDAVFAQPEIHLTQQLDLVLGARLTHDRKTGDDNSVLGTTLPIDYKKTKPTFLADVNYKVTDNILTYAKFATGYISGGQLATYTFKPETSKSYEAGIKADLLDRRLRANLAVFHADYKGIQLVTLGANVGVPAASQAVVNGGDGKATGFELETTAVPVNGLTIQGNVGYSDFKYKHVNPIFGCAAAVCGGGSVQDTFVPINRPKWTGNGSVQYETGEVVAGGHLVFRGDVNYKSKTDLGYNVPRPAAPDPRADAIRHNVVTQHSWIVNGRVALADVNIGGTKAELAVWGRNLFNNRQYTNISIISSFFYPGSYERARTYGADLFLNF